MKNNICWFVYGLFTAHLINEFTRSGLSFDLLSILLMVIACGLVLYKIGRQFEKVVELNEG